jgi:hypothetical protein
LFSIKVGRSRETAIGWKMKRKQSLTWHAWRVRGPSYYVRGYDAWQSCLYCLLIVLLDGKRKRRLTKRVSYRRWNENDVGCEMPWRVEQSTPSIGPFKCYSFVALHSTMSIVFQLLLFRCWSFLIANQSSSPWSTHLDNSNRLTNARFRTYVFSRY